MSIGKLITEPLLACLLIQGFLAATLIRARRRGTGTLLAATTIILGFLSTPVAGRWLERSLGLSPPTGGPSAYIVVLSGGYVQGESPALDVLGQETTARVLGAVECWKRRPTATVVMSGASYESPGRSRSAASGLMAELARQRGVPSERILQDDESRSTADHPVHVLRIAGITPETPITICTSSWHLRRALSEFRHWFREVSYCAPPAVRPVESWGAWFPSAGALSFSTTLFHEWLGLAWSRLSWSVLRR